MTAVMAEASTENPPRGRRGRSLDFWGDLSSTVDRAGGDPDRLWVDDSKAILCGGNGRCRLVTTCLAAIHAAGNGTPRTWNALLETLGAGTLDEVELALWLEVGGQEPDGPSIAGEPGLESVLEQQPLSPRCQSWKINGLRTVVIGPMLFNTRLSDQGLKSAVHYEAFERLLAWVWDRAADGLSTVVLGDKHGGRHYYYGPLTRSFPGTWIDRGPEGPELSRYTLRDHSRRVEVSLAPRADQNDGLVALASIVSKTIRELWMDVFNAYWCARVPGLRPTAGYPNDSKRFRAAIETVAAEQKCDPASWWRVK
jgi:hypothetical protein